MGVFDEYAVQAFPYRFAATLEVTNLMGGVPNDPKVIEGYIRSKVEGSDERIQRLIAETMVERGVNADQAIDEVAGDANVNGFKRMPETGELFIEGRQVKACLKEAASVAVAAGKIAQAGYGKASKQGKYLTKFLPEHLFVEEDRIGLGVKEVDGVAQKFLHVMTPQGERHSVSYVEYLDAVELSFHVHTDWDWAEEVWAMLWLTAQEIGIGADRSQGHGRFVVTAWEVMDGKPR